MELDIAEFRKMEAELHGFELPGFSMKFYYDETRNARKFRVSSNGVNSSDAVEYDYILRGIAFACKEEELNIDDLFKRIKLQPTAKALYEVVCKNKEEFYAILGHYEYPDVSDQNIRDFCMEIVCFIENYGDENDFYLECFRQMLKTNAKQGRLLYAQGEEKGELS